MSFISSTEQAIINTQQELNLLLANYDRWASQNPDKLIICIDVNDTNYAKSLEFRDWKQSIKMLRYKLNKLQVLQNSYKNTLLPVNFTSSI